MQNFITFFEIWHSDMEKSRKTLTFFETSQSDMKKSNMEKFLEINFPQFLLQILSEFKQINYSP